DLDEVAAAAEGNGVARRVDLLGWLDGTELAGAYARARVLALPSVWPEAFGLAGLEAVAHGLPVVASDVGGIPEWLDAGQSGELVPPGDATALADALAGLLGDPERADRLGAMGRSRASSNFSIDAHLERLIPLLERRNA